MNHRWNDPSGMVMRPGDFSATGVLHAAVLLLLARVALITLGFQRTATMVQRISSADAPRIVADLAQVRASRSTVSLAAAFVPARLLCLERSLVLYYKLRRESVPVALRLGVRAFPFVAHAWVELDGSPINEIRERLKDLDPIFELR